MNGELRHKYHRVEYTNLLANEVKAGAWPFVLISPPTPFTRALITVSNHAVQYGNDALDEVQWRVWESSREAIMQSVLPTRCLCTDPFCPRQAGEDKHPCMRLWLTDARGRYHRKERECARATGSQTKMSTSSLLQRQQRLLHALSSLQMTLANKASCLHPRFN